MKQIRFRKALTTVRKSASDDWKWGVGFERAYQARMAAAFNAYVAVLREALDGGINPDVLPYDEAERVMRAYWEKQARTVVVRAGEQAMEELGEKARFLIDNPYTVEWLKTHGAELITEVGRETKAAVRAEIQRGFILRRTVRETSMEIRNMVGLHSRQQKALRAFADNLVAQGVPYDDVIKRAARYAKQLIAQRALLIGRTETMTAMNAGIHAAWRVAMDQGLISPLSKRMWVAGAGSDRTCPICMSFHRTKAKMDEEFTSKAGVKRMQPPAHPACRCRAVLITVAPGMEQ